MTTNLCLVEAFHRLQPMWLVVAVVAEVGSMSAFALLQHRALSIAGITISMRRVLKITYASNAVSVTVPLAGSLTATAFTMSEYGRDGADNAGVVWTLLVTGIISTLSFALLTSVGAIASGDAAAACAGMVAAVAVTVPVVFALAAIRSSEGRRRMTNLATLLLRAASHFVKRPTGPQAIAETFIARLASRRLRVRDGVGLTMLAIANWVLDATCLAAAIAATGQSVPGRSLFAIYAAGIGAAAIGITPAGIGIVETALATVLLKAGVASSSALPAALVYRAISCWLVLAVGWIMVAQSRKHKAETANHELSRRLQRASARGLRSYSPERCVVR